jgi:carboxymethylenebutenolidase
MSQTLTLTADDGHTLSAYAAGEPTADASVVILQEIFGVNAHIRSVADAYAREGFFALAPALFDRVERGAELDYSPAGLERGRATAGRLQPGLILKDIAAAVAHGRTSVRSQKVGVVGYCLGGSYAWLSAASLPIDAAVGYYGSKIASSLEKAPRAPVILHFGALDNGIPLSDVERIRAAFPAVSVYVYNAGHGFNRDGSAAYSEEAAGLAKERTLSFLRANLRA